MIMITYNGKCVGIKQTRLVIIITLVIIFLTPLVDVVSNILQTCAVSVPPDVVDCIEHTYDTVVSILKTASSIYVPKVKKGFF